MSFKDMKLLVLAHAYTAWVKDLVESESRFLNEINVILHYNPLTEISNYIPFGGYFDHIRWYTRRRMLSLERKPENVSVHLVPLLYFTPDGKNKKLGDKLVKKFEEFIKQKRIEFDFIHAHFIYPQGYVAIKLGQKFNVPVVVTAHGHDIYEMPFRGSDWKKIIKQTLEQATHITTVSQRNKNIMTQKLDISVEKISVVPNGYDPTKFKPMAKEKVREYLNLSKDKEIILNIGNIYPIKGHKYLIEAIRKIIEFKNNILCVVIGEGSLKRKLENRVKKLALESCVIFIGAKPYNEIPLWMNAADLFVLPSLNEGNPTVMFEALGVGLPFVGTRVGGIPEIIISEEYGLLCEPGNVDDLIEKILIALDKEWDREKIKKYGEQFTWENIAKQTLEVYEKALRLFRD